MSSKPSEEGPMPVAAGHRTQSTPVPLYPIAKADPQAMPVQGARRAAAPAAAARPRVETELRSRDPAAMLPRQGAALSSQPVAPRQSMPAIAASNAITSMTAYPHGRGGMASVPIVAAAAAPREVGGSAAAPTGRPAVSPMPPAV